MYVYVLYTYWDTPDTEGNEIIGVYFDRDRAQREMRILAEKLKDEYDDSFWDEDMTWEDDDEIHLGHDPMKLYESATVYCWTIARTEVK